MISENVRIRLASQDHVSAILSGGRTAFQKPTARG